MPFCPNPDCDHRKRLGEPAEFLKGATACSDCGSALSETAPSFKIIKQPQKVIGWTCPRCGLTNHEDISLCSCGYDFNRPAIDVDEMPDYSRYTLEQLYDVFDHVDKEKYPYRFNTVRREIKRRESDPSIQPTQPPMQLQPDTPGFVIEFNGTAREYFRIWIVNLCLTLLSFGIFSAWAKVRKKRYFYSHTRLDGTPFQYLGQPVPILKGRIVAAAAFLCYYVSTHFMSSLLPYVLAAGMVFAPWMIIRSAAFNARYSAFRNMTFRFEGRYPDAAKVIYVLGLIPALVIGTIFNWWGKPWAAGIAFLVFGLYSPWWMRRFKGYLVEHTFYGGKKGTFFATGGQFFSIYFKSGLIVAGVGFVTSILAFNLFSLAAGSAGVWLFAIPIYAGYVLGYAYLQAHSGNLVWNHTHLGPLRFRSTMLGRGMAKLYFTNAVAIIASLGLLVPWAVMRTLKYRADNLSVLLAGDLADFSGSETGAVQAIGAETMDFFDMDISL